MLKLGCHLSIAKGFAKTAETAIKIGGNTFQFFSRNPRGSSLKQFDENDIKQFQEIRKKYQFAPIMAHAPYTMNLAGEKQEVYDFAKIVLKEDLKRMNSIGIEYFNFHPGSHVGQGIQKGSQKIIKAINEAIKGNETTMLLLETMPGKGSEIGHTFEQLKAILDGIEKQDKIGVCMDLCHVFSAGYDIKFNLEKVIKEFNQIIGMDRLKAIHLNDSMTEFNQRKDRHTSIGEGKIGFDAIIEFMKQPYLKELPYYLETPLEEDGHAKEIAKIKKALEK